MLSLGIRRIGGSSDLPTRGWRFQGASMVHVGWIGTQSILAHELQLGGLQPRVSESYRDHLLRRCPTASFLGRTNERGQNHSLDVMSIPSRLPRIESPERGYVNRYRKIPRYEVRHPEAGRISEQTLGSWLLRGGRKGETYSTNLGNWDPVLSIPLERVARGRRECPFTSEGRICMCEVRIRRILGRSVLPGVVRPLQGPGLVHMGRLWKEPLLRLHLELRELQPGLRHSDRHRQLDCCQHGALNPVRSVRGME